MPQIVGARVKVNPAAFVVGPLLRGRLWGAMGFVPAIPLENNSATYTLANLMAARPRHVLLRVQPKRNASRPTLAIKN